MNDRKIVISGTGCALADFIYNGISFDSPAFKKYLSRKPGDGGISPGKLVFSEELEKYSRRHYMDIIKDIIGNKPYDAFNLGGPSIVSLIHASQLLSSRNFEVKFFGIVGNDEAAERILNIARKTPLNIDNYQQTFYNSTPFTYVLSDPDFDNGNGERTFINNIGAAWNYTPELLDDVFYNSDIVCLGGTSLVPMIHKNLTGILKKAKVKGCITIVNTVFDFMNEKSNPGKPWPLVDTIQNLRLIDILIMDYEEALKISGTKEISSASKFFIEAGVSSFFITNGAGYVFFRSDGRLFKANDLTALPVSSRVKGLLARKDTPRGDTTGCGDNFAGGIIASVAMQLQMKSVSHLEITEALSWGIASGGFNCFTFGGTYLEQSPGEKLNKVKLIQEDYLNQIGYINITAPEKKLVLFGAGKIGRSFIGQLFSRGGYQVVFIDINEGIIKELNLRRSYNVIIKTEKGDEILVIENVRGVHAGNQKLVVEEIFSADIIAVSVGLGALDKIIPVLAKGLEVRPRRNENPVVDIIIGENMRNAEEYFRAELVKYLPSDYPLDKLVGLVETSIGKMVPIMKKRDVDEDILQVFAEPYNTLILNKEAFRNPIPGIPGLAPVKNMKAWVDRKLFIHNLGHSAAAYIGYKYNPDFIYIHEALAVKDVINNVRIAMMQAAYIIVRKYNDEFTFDNLCEHIEDLLVRFQNKALNDTIFRVGSDLMRKLGKEDRLAGAIRDAIRLNLPYNRILYALVCGCSFRAAGEDALMLKEDVEFTNRFQDDIRSVLRDVCGFNEIDDSKLFQEAEEVSNNLI